MKKKIIAFGLGMLAGSAGFSILKNETVKKAGVCVATQGLKIKDSVEEAVEVTRENVDDIMAEAKARYAAEKQAKRDLYEAEVEAEVEVQAE